MKSTRLRSIVVYGISLLFVIGIVFFLSEVFINGSSWATNAINMHIAEKGSLAIAGRITDRNGEVLAYTKNEERLYNENLTTRKAMLHTVGDDTKFISTAVQNSHRADLIGYNFITGLSLTGVVGSGNNIKLSLDSDICSKAYELLSGEKGTAVVYNYVTGEILCMASTPTYDPYNPPDSEEIEGDTDYSGVYLNKSLSASFTPGSIFKIITSATAINNIDNIYDRKFTCEGSYKIGDETITCMGHHGEIGLTEAMSESCNVVFAKIAVELGKEKMTKQAEEMGFNKNLQIDNINLMNSSYDVSNSTTGDLAWSGIGQYTDLVNPMHMAILMGAIANNGVPVMPYMIEKVETPFYLPTSVGYAKSGDRMLSVKTANELKNIMRYTVENNYGDSMFDGLTVCAKTGTGEVGEGKEPNAWMVGFSTDPDCKLAFSVVVENGGYGISAAGNIASKLMEMSSEIYRK